jgi:hypothetical protein
MPVWVWPLLAFVLLFVFRRSFLRFGRVVFGGRIRAHLVIDVVTIAALVTSIVTGWQGLAQIPSRTNSSPTVLSKIQDIDLCQKPDGTRDTSSMGCADDFIAKPQADPARSIPLPADQRRPMVEPTPTWMANP